MSEIFAYCIRIRGMNKTGRAVSGEGPSTCPMTFNSREAAVKFIADNGLVDVCYAGVMLYEEDYYMKTWPVSKVKLIKVK